MSKSLRCMLSLGLSLALASPAFACDLCSVYSAQLAQGQGATGWYAGISAQYTSYDELREGSRQIDDGGQYLDSSITQLFAGYGFDERWSLQLNLPYIDRSYKRLDHHGEAERGGESGIGDTTLLAQYLAYARTDEDTSVAWRLLAGIEFGTGSSDRLAEELEEDHAAGTKHEGEIPSGVHGHDLALGSGSTDFVLGTNVHGRSGKWLYGGELQYALRTEGDYNYEIGDDLQWTLGVGRYLVLEHTQSWALQLVLSGENKDYDELDGVRLHDTHQRTLALGPKLSGTFGMGYALELQTDFPLDQYVSEVQITQGWRVRGAFVARF